ncbi:50S ribosomal protein L24 [Candidatus Saccharibacteria bacterium]|nr:50S ribosomal protein L24 [Candidatus Saccharibacteria bacterium]
MKSLKINDKVMVISGSYKGTEAKIVGIDRESGKAMLEGIGVRERNLKRTQFNPRGDKKTVRLGIDFSNLKLVEAAKFVKSSVKKVDSKADKKAEKKAEKEAKKAKKGAK